jgi:hypothetical protein
VDIKIYKNRIQLLCANSEPHSSGYVMLPLCNTIVSGLLRTKPGKCPLSTRLWEKQIFQYLAYKNWFMWQRNLKLYGIISFPHSTQTTVRVMISYKHAVNERYKRATKVTKRTQRVRECQWDLGLAFLSVPSFIFTDKKVDFRRIRIRLTLVSMSNIL